MLWVEELTDSRTETGMWVLCGWVFNWGNGKLGEDTLKKYIYLLENGWVGCLSSGSFVRLSGSFGLGWVGVGRLRLRAVLRCWFWSAVVVVCRVCALCS